MRFWMILAVFWLNFLPSTMADEFHELVGNSDSEEEFEGFVDIDFDDLEVQEIDVNDIDLDENEVNEIIQEIDQEFHDPKYQAYECDWLKNFDEHSGPRHIDDDATASEIFLSIFDNEIISLLVEETNAYYHQYVRKAGGLDNIKPNARARKWTDVTNAEMKAFIGILLYIGLVRLPNYESYWNNDDLLSLKGLTQIMPRDRFLNLLAFFHTANNDNEPPRDSPNFQPTYKFHKLSQLLLERWQRYYYPSREISVDETLIPFKGRTKYLQYIPSKPHKWGLKVWTLADSATGYVFNWKMYTGKGDGAQGDGRGVAHKVVVDLCSPLLDNGHHLYCDNFFTSPALFHELSDRQTGACGTLRVNRIGVPREVKLAKPKKEDPPHLYRDGNKLYIS